MKLLFLLTISAVAAFGQGDIAGGKFKKGISHLYLGRDTSTYFTGEFLSDFSTVATNDTPWGFTIAKDGNGYATHAFWFFNSTTGVYQDLFHTGAQVILKGSTIADQVYFIESVKDDVYANELAVRPSLITLRNSLAFCWSSIDDAVGLGLGYTPNPDTCLRRSAPGVVSVETGQIGVEATFKADSVVAGSVRLAPTAIQPACDGTSPGQFWYTAGGTGVQDAVQVCAKDGADAWAWRTIY